jgi:hypothetical protein
VEASMMALDAVLSSLSWLAMGHDKPFLKNEFCE